MRANLDGVAGVSGVRVGRIIQIHPVCLKPGFSGDEVCDSGCGREQGRGGIWSETAGSLSPMGLYFKPG